MNNQGPIGPEFTEEALNKKFSFSFTRRQLIGLARTLAKVESNVMNPDTLNVCEVVDEIDRTAFRSVTDSDYKKPKTTPTEPLQPEVQVN